MKITVYMILLLAMTMNSYAQGTAAKVIFDTDMGPDYDDVGALAILHHLADEGKADILATVSSNKMEKTVQLIHVLNTYYGRPDIPVGVVKQGGLSIDTWHKGKKWTDELLEKYPTGHPIATETEDAVSVYRRILEAQPNNSVTIITVGFLTNLHNLLHSSPDSISPLSGFELVRQKVRRLVSMAGRFPEGREYNVYAEAKSAKHVAETWPTEIVFSGTEIGRYIRTGDRLIHASMRDNPVKDAYQIAIPQDMLEFDNSRYEMGGRASYDQTAVLVGVNGIEEYFGAQRGRITVFDDGRNQWEEGAEGPHVRLLHKYSYQHMASIIEDMMMHPPKIQGFIFK